MTIYDQIQNIQADYSARAARINQNKDLSQIGRDKALQALTADKNTALKSLVPTLRKQAVTTAIKANKMSGCQWALGQEEKGKTDWGRLTYEASAVKSALVLAGGDPYKIQGLFEAAKATGDSYKLRAWMDTAPATFPEDPQSFGREWEDLKTDILKSKNLVASEEMAKYETQKNVHLEELTMLSRTAAVLAEDLAGGAAYRAQNVMARIFDGIVVVRETGELKLGFSQLENESEDQMFSRLEGEYVEHTKQQAVVFEKFGADYDPLLEGVG